MNAILSPAPVPPPPVRAPHLVLLDETGRTR
jgi:hypothetical protein